MKIKSYWVAMVLFASCSYCHATGSGTWYHEGKAVVLPNVYAFRMPSPYEDGKQITRIVFTSQVIDAGKIAAATDREAAVRGMLAGSDYLDLNLSITGEFAEIGEHEGYNRASVSGSGWFTLKLAHNDDKRIEGTFRTNDASKKKTGEFFDLAFAVNLPGQPAATAATLPSDGGAPGKVYLAYLAAVTKGDLDAMQATMTPARAQELASMRDSTQFKMMFGLIQSRALREPKFVTSHDDGSDATLEYSGKDASGNAVSSKVAMKLEGGAWKIDKVSDSTHLH